MLIGRDVSESPAAASDVTALRTAA
jgi:hypothetical protein